MFDSVYILTYYGFHAVFKYFRREVVLSALPSNWKELGKQTKALNYMREISSPEVLLRILLLHIAKGYSLRETVIRAKAAQLASISDVALLKRLKKSELWLKELCHALLEENGVELSHCFFKVLSHENKKLQTNEKLLIYFRLQMNPKFL